MVMVVVQGEKIQKRQMGDLSLWYLILKVLGRQNQSCVSKNNWYI